MERSHFQNQTGSYFSKLECQLACALDLYVRTRRHHPSHIDHSQPPTLEMLNGILREARLSIWHEAHRRGYPCNPMRPDAHLNAYCLVRNLRHSPNYRWWYEEVRNDRRYWESRADDMFLQWLNTNSRLVYEYVIRAPPSCPWVYGC